MTEGPPSFFAGITAVHTLFSPSNPNAANTQSPVNGRNRDEFSLTYLWEKRRAMNLYSYCL